MTSELKDQLSENINRLSNVFLGSLCQNVLIGGGGVVENIFSRFFGLFRPVLYVVTLSAATNLDYF